ncbi:MAG: glycosyltransferase [Candidatus Bathyarchaeia archaeon]
MKIGFVLSQPFGKSIGTDVRIRGLLEGLSQFGVELHLISPFDEKESFPSANIIVHKVGSSFTNLKISGFTYNVYKKIGNNSFLFRNLLCKKSLITKNARSFGKGVSEIVQRLDLDVLQAEQQIASIACVMNKEKIGIPIVADFHGIWAEEMVASGIIGYNDASYKTLFEIEQEIANSADCVSVVSEEMKNYVESRFMCSNNKVRLIPNAAFLKSDLRMNNKSPSKVIHSGTLHPWENVELFVKSMPFVLDKKPTTEFYLTRKGAKLNKLIKLAQGLKVSPNFIWFENRVQFDKFLPSCDVGVISSTSHIARQMAYPAKLYDYLSVGLPIVVNSIGAWTEIIRQNGLGVVTDSTPQGFAEGLLSLLENPDLLNECGQRGIELVKREMNYYRSAEKLMTLYEQLA